MMAVNLIRPGLIRSGLGHGFESDPFPWLLRRPGGIRSGQLRERIRTSQNGSEHEGEGAP